MSWLRPSDTYTSNNSAGSIEQIFAMLHEGIHKLLVRADSRFFSDKLIQAIESRKNTEYLIKVKIKN